MGREHETDIIPKMTYRWPTGTWKDAHSTWLVARETQITATMRNHLTHVRMAIIKKTTEKIIDKNMGKRNLLALLLGMQTGATTIENTMEIPQKLKNGTTIWSGNSTS